MKQYSETDLTRIIPISISKARLKEYFREGLISEKTFLEQKHKKRSYVQVVEIQKRGNTFAAKKLNIQNAYTTGSPFHNLKMAQKLKEMKAEERDSIKTETELKKILRDKIKEIKKEEPTKYREIIIKYEKEYDGFEKALKDDFVGSGSTPDMAYYNTTTESWECYEVITHNYKEVEIVMKKFSAEVMGMGIELPKV